MPVYLYQNEQTGEIKEIVQSMSEKHEYSENGIAWVRIFTIPTAAVDTVIDPWSSKDFVEKTRNKKGTLGGIWDQSAELSEKRKGNSNVDPVKEKNYSDYEKAVGKPHINKIREKSKEKLKKLGISISK